jgi:hypothetical protein
MQDVVDMRHYVRYHWGAVPVLGPTSRLDARFVSLPLILKFGY